MSGWPTRYDAFYQVAIINEDTEQTLGVCDPAIYSQRTTCSAVVSTNWSMNKAPRPIGVRAEVVGGSSVARATVDVSRAEFHIDLQASPTSVEVPGQSRLEARIDQSVTHTPYNIEIYRDDTGEKISDCRGDSQAPRTFCSVNVATNWSMNKNPQPLSYSAVVRSADDVVSNTARVTVSVRRAEFHIDLEASPTSVQVPNRSRITATVDQSVSSTPYNIEIYRDDTGAKISDCRSEFVGERTTCYVDVYPDWSMNKDPSPLSYSAVVRSADDIVSNTAHTTVEVDPFYFDVGLSFANPRAGAGGTVVWKATASSSRSVWSTPYTLRIESMDGSVMTSCTWQLTCEVDLGPGTYRTSVEDALGDSFGRSSWWTLTNDGAWEENLDDVDLIALAGMFATPAAVCEALLLGWTGTHVMSPPSSLSDQYRVCTAAVQASKSTLGVLAAVAGAHGGTRVLSWLYDEAVRDTPDDPDDEPDPTPVPPPPVFWPDGFESDVDRLMSQNPLLTKRRVARTVLRQCYQYASRATLAESECLRLPIFASGDLDVPEPTAHDRASILKRPRWVQLTYRAVADRPDRRDWYASDSRCSGSSKTIHCHEYPYFSTQQGGGTAVPRPRLKLVAGGQNLSQGTNLGHFYRRCGLRATGTPFLSVPMPAGSNVPTSLVCNGNG